jgi:AbiTii
VPKAVIEKHGGEAWLTISERQSVYALEDIIARTKGGMLTIDAANLILLLQGKMYPNMNCASVEGVVSVGEVVALLAAVRSRVLELTIQLEKSAPIAAMVSLGGEPTKQNEREAGTVTNITNQVIYGSYTSISNSNKGDGDQTTMVTDQSTNKSINIDASEEIISNVRDALNSGGIPSSDLPKLLEALDQLKNAKDKPSRLSAYNHFMSVCANHIGVIMPFVEPLQRMFLT